MPPEAPNPAVANAVMASTPDAATPIAQPQRRKVSELTALVQSGEMPDVAYDPASRSPAPGNTVRTLDAPLFADNEGHEATAIEPAFVPDDGGQESHEAELVSEGDYAAIKAAWDEFTSSDDLPEKYLGTKWVTATVQGKPERITLKEAVDGYQTQRDYSIKLGKVAERERACDARDAGMNRMIADLHNPQTFPQVMRVLGTYGRLHDRDQKGHPIQGTGSGYLGSADLLGDELYEELTLRQKNPEAYARLQRERQSEARAWQIAQENQQLKAQLQQAQQQKPEELDETGKQAAHQMQQMIPLAYKAAGIDAAKAADQLFALDWEANAEKIFELHYANLLPTLEGPLTTAFVTMVVQATKQTVQQRAASVGKPVPNPNQPPINQGLTGAPTRQGQPGSNGAPKRAKVSDMSRLLGTFR